MLGMFLLTIKNLNMVNQNKIYVLFGFLGLLSCYIIKPAPNVSYTNENESPISCYTKLLISNLESNVAMQQRMACMVISEWCKLQKLNDLASKILAEKVTDCMNRIVYYDEMSYSITKLIQDAHDFLASLKHYKMLPPQHLNPVSYSYYFVF